MTRVDPVCAEGGGGGGWRVGSKQTPQISSRTYVRTPPHGVMDQSISLIFSFFSFFSFQGDALGW